MTDLAYLNTRLESRKKQFLPRDALEELMTVPDMGMVTDRLLGSAYDVDLAESLRIYPARRAIDEALNAHLHRNLDFVLSEVTGPAREGVLALVEGWDIQCIKTILRGLRMECTPEEIRCEAGLGARLSRHHIEAMVDMPNVKAAVDLLITWGMPWGTVLKPLVIEYRKTSDLRPLEFALDGFRFRHLGKGGQSHRLRDKIAVKLIVAEWEAINILLCLTFLNLEEPAPLLLVPGRKSETVDALSEAQTLEEAIAVLVRSDFRAVLDAALPFIGGGGRFSMLERLMDDELLRQSGRESMLDPLSLAVPCHFLRCKQNEVRNLRLIARGVAAGLPPNSIRPGLILRPAA